MAKPTVFIGSSSENKDVARALEVNLSECAEVNIWDHSFSPGQSVYHELLKLSHSFDFAVLIINPDDRVISREVEQLAPRDNVIFELGLFLGAIGTERVFAIAEAGRKSKIMSDYLGVTYLTYDANRTDGNLTKALSPASTQIIDVIHSAGRINSDQEIDTILFPGEMIGLEKIYDSFDAARSNIYDDLKSTDGPIRIFVHVASQDMGLKGAFFDVLDDVVKKGSVDIRVLHAAPDSPLFVKDRLVALGKNYERVMASLEYATTSLRVLESIEGSTLRRRSHSLPFIWRLYFVFERVYFMPYFSEKDAVKTSPVLVFTRKDKSLYHVFKDWFDHAWEISSPERVALSDIISPATPAGAALFLKWEGQHVFGVPRRDVIANPGRVRFYGIGGKRESAAETFEGCALREANEELGGSIASLQDALHTTYMRSDGTMRDIAIYGSTVKPRLILEKADHSGLGILGSNAEDYVLVAYEADLTRKPTPSSELSAILLLNEECFELFLEQAVVTIADIRSKGGLVVEQSPNDLSDQTVLIPHGTAAFMLRTLVT